MATWSWRSTSSRACAAVGRPDYLHPFLAWVLLEHHRRAGDLPHGTEVDAGPPGTPTRMTAEACIRAAGMQGVSMPGAPDVLVCLRPPPPLPAPGDAGGDGWTLESDYLRVFLPRP